MAERLVGRRIRVYWAGDEVHYAGVVDSYNAEKRTHSVQCEHAPVVAAAPRTPPRNPDAACPLPVT